MRALKASCEEFLCLPHRVITAITKQYSNVNTTTDLPIRRYEQELKDPWTRETKKHFSSLPRDLEHVSSSPMLCCALSHHPTALTTFYLDCDLGTQRDPNRAPLSRSGSIDFRDDPESSCVLCLWWFPIWPPGGQKPQELALCQPRLYAAPRTQRPEPGPAKEGAGPQCNPVIMG